MCVCFVCVCMCVCVCVRRERRESVCVCVCMCEEREEREGGGGRESMELVRVSVCVRKENLCENICQIAVYGVASVVVCVRKRESKCV